METSTKTSYYTLPPMFLFRLRRSGKPGGIDPMFFTPATGGFNGNAVTYFIGPDSEVSLMTEVTDDQARVIFANYGGNPALFDA